MSSSAQNFLSDPVSSAENFLTGGATGVGLPGQVGGPGETQPISDIGKGGALAAGPALALGAPAAGAAGAADAAPIFGDAAKLGGAAAADLSVPTALAADAAGGAVSNDAITNPGAAEGAAGSSTPAILTAASPTMTLDPATSLALGIEPGIGGITSYIPAAGTFDSAVGVMPGGAPDFGTGITDGAIFDPGAAAGATGDSGGGVTALLKKMGLTPATAGLLGIAGAQAFMPSNIPDASKRLASGAGPAADQANAVIQSGGTSSPAWAGQKSSIDATIDQQIKEQTAAMLQQAINSGQGADSQVTLQQINKLKDQLETQRQNLYAQAQSENVKAAISQLGISDQALAQVANAEYASDNQAQSQAAHTAELALLLGSLGK